MYELNDASDQHPDRDHPKGVCLPGSAEVSAEDVSNGTSQSATPTEVQAKPRRNAEGEVTLQGGSYGRQTNKGQDPDPGFKWEAFDE